ncbi:MAG: TatD family hydrolase [Planctomycetota bacterium]|jgi:TatD DNase family protein
MGLIDSHAHVTFPQLAGDLDSVWERCDQVGVDQVITIGTDLSDSRAALVVAEAYPRRVRVGSGFHPHEAEKVADDHFAQMAELWNRPEVVAAGEMGLDYHYDFADRQVQQRVFRKQLELAADRDLPIIIHARESLDDTVGILTEMGYRDRKVVFHCFTGTAEEAERIAEHGWRISFTGIVTFKKSEWLQQIAKDYPADRLMVETDAPYLSPVPVRNTRTCEPSFVAHTARFLAGLRGEDYDVFVEQTSANTRAFFGF